MALPYLNLYIGDILKDTDVLSPAAFGGYVRLLFKMHAASPRGEVYFTLPQLCRVFAAATIEETKEILNEITDPAHKICEYSKKGETHYFVNRRMKKETLKSQVKSAAGKLGAAKTNERHRRNKEIAEQVAATKKSTGNESTDSVIHPAVDQQNYNINIGNNSELKETAAELFFNVDTQLPYISLEAIERNQFTCTKNKNTDYILSQWKIFLSERLADPPERQCQFRQLSDLTSYFINWMRNKFPQDASDKNNRKTNSKNTGAYQLLESLRGDL